MVRAPVPEAMLGTQTLACRTIQVTPPRPGRYCSQSSVRATPLQNWGDGDISQTLRRGNFGKKNVCNQTGTQPRPARSLKNGAGCTGARGDPTQAVASLASLQTTTLMLSWLPRRYASHASFRAAASGDTHLRAIFVASSLLITSHRPSVPSTIHVWLSEGDN